MWGELRVDESFPSVEMRVVSPSVESVMKLLVYSTFFLRWLFKCSLMEDGGQLTKLITFQQRNNEKNQNSFQERKGNESGTVGNGNKLHEKSVHGKEMTEMSFTCQ